jgi:hypothetical protein
LRVLLNIVIKDASSARGNASAMTSVSVDVVIRNAVEDVVRETVNAVKSVNVAAVDVKAVVERKVIAVKEEARAVGSANVVAKTLPTAAKGAVNAVKSVNVDVKTRNLKVVAAVKKVSRDAAINANVDPMTINGGSRVKRWRL